ncbi:hypothetical protein KEJ49_02665 [Candidatus Bathyarchaeota archaeon]|nr:hypothetical protein [Candidatus Bathyarchaeota archaeon]
MLQANPLQQPPRGAGEILRGGFKGEVRGGLEVMERGAMIEASLWAV